MTRIRGAIAWSAAMLAVVSAGAVAQDADLDELYELARAEGTVVLYSATDTPQVQGLLDAFVARYPGITVDYNDVGAEGTFNRVISEAAANQVGADLVWTSAMDRQMTLAQQGLFEAVPVAEAANLPDWANYNDILYATSVEPVGIIYNQNLLSEDMVPRSRAELIEFMRSDVAQGQVAALDPERSPSGWQFHYNDSVTTDDYWELIEAFGAAGGRTYTSNGPVRESINSGENALAFNIIGSYAIEWAEASPTLGAAFEADRTASFARVIALTNGAPHPNAARLFLEFVLSNEGQTELSRSGLPSVRGDIDPDIGFDLDSIEEYVGGNIEPIPLDESLLIGMGMEARSEFYDRWRELVRSE